MTRPVRIVARHDDESHCRAPDDVIVVSEFITTRRCVEMAALFDDPLQARARRSVRHANRCERSTRSEGPA